MKIKGVLILLLLTQSLWSQQLALLKYKGGGDWYVNPTSLPNLIAFCNARLGTRLDPKPATVSPDSRDLFQYPFVHLTGHGNIFFDEADVENLRNYLTSGGFLHADDNYGLDPYIRKEIKKLFPDIELTELPKDHPIFNAAFPFPEGLPKIHEHDGKRPLAMGIFYRGRLVLLYTTETDLGDGWENPEIHNDPPDVRQKALRMGANIVKYVFEN